MWVVGVVNACDDVRSSVARRVVRCSLFDLVVIDFGDGACDALCRDRCELLSL